MYYEGSAIDVGGAGVGAELGLGVTIGQRRWVLVCVAIALILGIVLRCVHIDRNPYSPKEISNLLRVVGHSDSDILGQIGARPVPAAQLQRYLQRSSEKRWSNTIAALRQHPQQSPLFVLLARFWADVFGHSVLALRSLSVLFALLLLPLIYGFGRAVFGDGLIGLLAMGLLALSPMPQAQVVQEYTLWACEIVGATALLGRAIQQGPLTVWLLYGGMIALSFYTTAVAGWLLLAHGIFVLLTLPWRQWWKFGAAVGGAIALFFPWFLAVVAPALDPWAREDGGLELSRSLLELGLMPWLLAGVFAIAAYLRTLLLSSRHYRWGQGLLLILLLLSLMSWPGRAQANRWFAAEYDGQLPALADEIEYAETPLVLLEARSEELLKGIALSELSPKTELFFFEPKQLLRHLEQIGPRYSSLLLWDPSPHVLAGLEAQKRMSVVPLTDFPRDESDVAGLWRVELPQGVNASNPHTVCVTLLPGLSLAGDSILEKSDLSQRG